MATYYVSTTGSDAANGLSLTSAFATLERAQDAMRLSGGNDTTLIRGGTYYLDQPLTLTAQDNGSRFAGYGTETAVLSGGTALTNWTKGANGVWTAPLAQADLHQLTLDGVRQTEARYPNAVPEDPIKGGWLWAKAPPAGVDPVTHLAYDPADLAGGKIAVGMQVHFFTDASWASNTRTITALDTARGVMTFDEPAYFKTGASSRYYIEDGKVHLDQPGEWWFDTATQTVHYKAPPGFDGTGVVASGLHNIIEITDAARITITGLTFSDATSPDGQDGNVGTGVDIVRSANNIVTNNNFTNLTQGVHVFDDSRGNTVSNNTITHTLGAAINLDYNTGGSTVTDNDIRWTNEAFVFPGAIQMDETRDNLVAHNLIRDVPRMGIQVDHSSPTVVSGNNVIEYNSVLRAMQQTADGGSIYIWSGSDRVAQGDIIRYNRIIDAGGLEPIPGGFRPEREYSNGIYLDDYTSRTQVYGNMIEGTVRGGIYLHGGSFNSVHDNIVIGNKDIGIQFFEIGETMRGNDVYRNIVQATTDSAGNTVELNPSFVAPGTLHDNFYWNPDGQALNFSGKTFAAWQALGYDAGSQVFSSALFERPIYGNWNIIPGNFPLTAGFVAPPIAAIATFATGQIIYGSAKADTLSGGPGDDTMEGFSGNDVLTGADGDDYLTGDQGNDTLYCGSGDDHAFGGSGRDRLWGDYGDDQLMGYGDEDRLLGDLGNDTMRGGTGNDTLWGGQGADVFYGEQGADAFLFNNANESGTTFATMDRIEDYEDGIDKMYLGLIDANANRTGNQTFRLSATSSFDGQAGSLRIIERNGDTLVMADLNGDKVADFTIKLEGLLTLTALDFIL